MAKHKKDINIQVLGESGNDVTGSCVLIKTPERQILLECGLYQDCGDTLDSYKINKKKFEFKPKELDYIFVMHCHQDHLGNVPRLYAQGSTAPLIMPYGTYETASILLTDSANIMARDAEDLSKQYGRRYSPIYTPNDVERALEYVSNYPFDELIKLDENISFRFIHSGHIVNSAQLELWVTSGNITKKIVYTSDLGNEHIPKAYTAKFEPIDKADVVIGESTYAGEKRIANMSMRQKDLDKLKAAVETTCIDNKARMLLPCFANDRTQNMLTILYSIFGEDKTFEVPILVDSPMAVRCCKAYYDILKDEDLALWEKVCSWKNVVFVTDAEESRKWRDSKKSCLVLSSSGMLTQGRSVAWVYELLPNASDRIVFCGYSADGSLASTIKRGEKKTITVSGKQRANKCQVTNLTSFTSHIQRDSLLHYYSSIECEKIVLVHGDMDGRISFAKELQNKISENNLTSKVIIASKGWSINI